MKRAALGAVLVIALAAPASATPASGGDLRAAGDAPPYAELMLPFGRCAGASQAKVGGLVIEDCGSADAYSAPLAWYTRLAEQGDAAAMGAIALLHEMGLGAPADQAEAVRWYQRAAAFGDAPSQLRLAELYAQGVAVSRDDVQALMWFLVAAREAGADDALRARAEAGRADLEARMSGASVAAASQLARNWHPALSGASVPASER